RIECQGYKKLETLGAPSLKKVYTAGGGAQNSTWQTIRQQQLGVAVAVADQTEAAYGTALLALRGLSQFTQKPR
ncbi:MAG: carbohydrate kinase, partial [Cyanobacteria bacterium J06560_6]